MKPHYISLLSDEPNSICEPGVAPKIFFPRSVASGESWLIEFPHEVVGFLRISFRGRGTVQYRCGESRNEALGLPFGHVEHSDEWPQREDVQLVRGEDVWQSVERFAARWCKLTLTPEDPPLEVISIGIAVSGHQIKAAGDFVCSDPRMNALHETGVRTARLCMQEEFYEDGVRRDKLPWIFDALVTALVNYYSFGDRDLFRSTWRFFAGRYSGEGIIGAHTSLWDYACWWNIGLYTHYLYLDDSELVYELYPTAKKNIDALLARRDKHGLLVKEGRREVFGGGEALLFKALQDTAKLAAVVGDQTYSTRYELAAQQVGKAVNAYFWDTARGCYLDPRPPHANIGHRCSVVCVEESLNSFAMLYGIADSHQASSAAKYLQRNLWGPYGSFPVERPRKADGGFGPIIGQSGPPVHNDCVWPVMNFFQVEALFAHGLPQAWDLLARCWGNMLDRGADTYWECVHEDGTIPALWTSLCHGWSSGISYTLPATVAGVRPLSPGYRTFTVKPQLGALEWIRVAVPTPFGQIKVEVSKGGNRTDITIISAPDECRYEKA
ncbi:MAG: alpha-L-rhamnosidase C-terminal domain-containing protein [Lentisphaeria bacterium]|nr:alpha-L-rhamnosidase C-terminal domain-containing protein [Lentisphaeria bacterium]